LTLTSVLNPLESDINTYPETVDSVRIRWARKLFLPSARFIPKAALSLRGRFISTPGRLYTFVGRKDK